jgi:hypothetical protein
MFLVLITKMKLSEYYPGNRTHTMEARKYYLSLSEDFVNHEELLFVDMQYLIPESVHEKYQRDLIMDNVNKVIKQVYGVSKEYVSGSLIVFEDNSFQYITYNHDFSHDECYIGYLSSTGTTL